MKYKVKMKGSPFDSWTEKYDDWFTTATTEYVKTYELELLLELLQPQPGEKILDAGCGNGIFTEDVVKAGSIVTGMDLSLPMLTRAVQQLGGGGFHGLCADMCALPFSDNIFDKAFSMTAIEFIEDAACAIGELSRVVKPGGTIVVTTLNSLSPWAARRREKAKQGHPLFGNIYFRSPEDMRKLVPENCAIKTAIHFPKDAPVKEIPRLEEEGDSRGLGTGAFLAVQWQKS